MNRPKRLSEEAITLAIFQWRTLASCTLPLLDFLYHIPNEGKRTAIAGARMKLTGLRVGIPDLHLPVPQRGWFGFWCEVKAHPNKPSQSQLREIGRLWGLGHFVCVAYSEPECTELLYRYALNPESLHEFKLPPGLRARRSYDENIVVRNHAEGIRDVMHVA